LYVTVEHRIADTTHTQGVQNLSCIVMRDHMQIAFLAVLI